MIMYNLNYDRTYELPNLVCDVSENTRTEEITFAFHDVYIL